MRRQSAAPPLERGHATPVGGRQGEQHDRARRHADLCKIGWARAGLPQMIDAVRAGRTFVSNGPLLGSRSRVRGGSTLTFRSHRSRDRARAAGLEPLDRLRIGSRRRVIAEATPMPLETGNASGGVDRQERLVAAICVGAGGRDRAAVRAIGADPCSARRQPRAESRRTRTSGAVLAKFDELLRRSSNSDRS